MVIVRSLFYITKLTYRAYMAQLKGIALYIYIYYLHTHTQISYLFVNSGQIRFILRTKNNSPQKSKGGQKFTLLPCPPHYYLYNYQRKALNVKLFVLFYPKQLSERKDNPAAIFNFESSSSANCPDSIESLDSLSLIVHHSRQIL